jgi:hypothetical protein
MNNLPIEIVYDILTYSGHGTLRNGFVHYDKVMKPCQFIFKLHNRALKIKPIKNNRVRLQISETKHMETTVSHPFGGEMKQRMIIWHDPYKHLHRSGNFAWCTPESPTYETIYTEWIRPRQWNKK